jgi:hypothetical protein
MTSEVRHPHATQLSMPTLSNLTIPQAFPGTGTDNGGYDQWPDAPVVLSIDLIHERRKATTIRAAVAVIGSIRPAKPILEVQTMVLGWTRKRCCLSILPPAQDHRINFAKATHTLNICHVGLIKPRDPCSSFYAMYHRAHHLR